MLLASFLLLLLLLLLLGGATLALKEPGEDADADAVAATAAAAEPDDADSAPYPIPPNLPLPLVAATRSERFPSVDQRIKLYMSDWYAPPCATNRRGRVRYRYNNATATTTNTTTTSSSNSSSSSSSSSSSNSSQHDDDEDWPTLIIGEPLDRGNGSRSSNGSDESGGGRVHALTSRIEADTPFFLDRATLLECIRPEGTGDPRLQHRIGEPRSNMFLYCSDAAQSILTALDHLLWERALLMNHSQNNTGGGWHPHDDFPPILLQFGDLRHSHYCGYLNVPHIKKFRSATTRDELERVTDGTTACRQGPRQAIQTPHTDPLERQLQPLVWKLATSRHFRLLYKVHRYDTPWKGKKNMAVFRGQLTGAMDGYDKDLSDEENCLRLRRCRLVYRHANSTLVHATLTSTRNRLPSVLRGVPLLGRSVPLSALLQYKGLIMLEGNDVSSGLKWALLSQSVVLMPEPRHTSWAMEERLEPWVHYVPLNARATDVEEKMQWIVDHDELARRIAERSTLWMEDLVFHPDALEDDRLIQEEMLRRYAAHFVRDDSVGLRTTDARNGSFPTAPE